MDLFDRILELSRYGYFCGQILAILAMFYPAMPKKMEKLEVYPDFKEKKLEADTEITGHIFLCVLLFQALKVILTKDVRDLYARIKAKNPEDPSIRRAAEKEKKKAKKKAAKERKRRQKKKQKKKKQ